MLSADIVEREDRKRLDLLRFAMERAGVVPGAWAIGMTFEELRIVDDAVCLWKEDGNWVVSYTERGTWTEMGRFPISYHAANYFYAQFRAGPSLYEHREEWERETGISFAMVDDEQ